MVERPRSERGATLTGIRGSDTLLCIGGGEDPDNKGHPFEPVSEVSGQDFGWR